MKHDKPKARCKVDISKLASALASCACASPSTPFPVRSDIVLAVYTWMLGTARKHNVSVETGWGEVSAFGQIASLSGAVNILQAADLGASWRPQIRNRIVRALYEKGFLLEAWRVKAGLDPLPNGVWIKGPFAASKDGWKLEQTLDELMDLPGRVLRLQLNPFHPGAKYVTRIALTPSETAWSTRMMYGFDGSEWDADTRDIEARCRQGAPNNPLHVVQQPDESLCAFAIRAKTVYEEMLLPASTTACRRADSSRCAPPPCLLDSCDLYRPSKRSLWGYPSD